MLRKTSFLIVFIQILTFSCLFAQKKDSVVFGIQDFYSQIIQFHPIIKQANLLSELGKQEIRLARGNFDPKIESSFLNKQFKNKEYYNQWNSQLKIPVWFGTDLKFGFERNTGEFLDPSLAVPAEGLAYANLTVPLGQGMLIDQRRAMLREAQATNGMLEAEKIKNINKMLLQAAKDYWNWYHEYFSFLITQKGYDLAKFRFESSIEQVKQGDLAGIDSVEAKIMFQQREIERRQAKIDLINASFILSNHLWNKDQAPLDLDSTLIPVEKIGLEKVISLPDLLDFAKTNHPEIQKLQFKKQQIEIKRRLGVEMLKPVINLNYSLLSATPLFKTPYFESNYLSNNYKFSLDFSFPLFLRKERAKLQQAKIYDLENTFETQNRAREIENEIKAHYNELQNLERQIALQEEQIRNYQILVNGEQQKFMNGESTIFYVNIRESKMLEAEQKLVSLRYKYAKTQAELLWAAGKNGLE